MASEVTQLLHAWGAGDQEAFERLVPLVYGELRRLAKNYMRGERAGHTLQTTALINEAYLRLTDWQQMDWKNRAHFLGIAAQMMRRVLVDAARERHYAKRGGGAWLEALDDINAAAPARDGELIALDEALARLAELAPRQSQIVELRFFGGLSVEETAQVLQIAPRTVLREWQTARAWLYRELKGDAQ